MLDKVEKLGGKRLLPPAELPSGPTPTMFADPDANVTGLILGEQPARNSVNVSGYGSLVQRATRAWFNASNQAGISVLSSTYHSTARRKMKKADRPKASQFITNQITELVTGPAGCFPNFARDAPISLRNGSEMRGVAAQRACL